MKYPHRLLCFAILNLTSPLHIGSGKVQDPWSDQPVLRDVEGIPFIPGGTLAGAFGASIEEEWRSKWMEGGKPGSEPFPSDLIVDDAYPLPDQQQALRWPVEIRGNNTLLRDSLTTKKDHFFQPEVLPVGCAFCFSCRCDFETEAEVEEFKSCLRNFFASSPSLGGKQNAGQGRFAVEEIGWRYLNLNKAEDLKLWLKKGHGYDWDGKWDGLEHSLGVQRERVKEKSFDQWRMILTVEIKEGLHLSAGTSGLPRKNMPDQVQAKRQIISPTGEITSEFVDYGTAIKGRLRTLMEMLLRTYLVKGGADILKAKELVPPDPAPAGKWAPKWPEISDFFGFGGEKGGPRGRRNLGKKGIWKVEESPWKVKGDDSLQLFPQDHIQLCEFTQQVINGAKFEFAPLKNGQTQVTVVLKQNSEDWQKLLVKRAGQLLALNIIPFGGYGSRGYLGARIIDMRIEGGDPNPKALKEFVENKLTTETQRKEDTCLI